MGYKLHDILDNRIVKAEFQEEPEGNFLKLTVAIDNDNLKVLRVNGIVNEQITIEDYEDTVIHHIPSP